MRETGNGDWDRVYAQTRCARASIRRSGTRNGTLRLSVAGSHWPPTGIVLASYWRRIGSALAVAVDGTWDTRFVKICDGRGRDFISTR